MDGDAFSPEETYENILYFYLLVSVSLSLDEIHYWYKTDTLAIYKFSDLANSSVWKMA